MTYQFKKIQAFLVKETYLADVFLNIMEKSS